MRFSVRAGTLQSALGHAAAAISKRPPTVAYSAALLEVSSGRLTVTGSDSETTVAVTEKVTRGTDGKALLPPQPLQKFLATLAADHMVEVEAVTDTQLKVTPDGESTYTFRTLSTTYAIPPALRREKVTVDLHRLALALDAVKDSANTLAGSSGRFIQLVSSQDGLRLHSTDRYRLTRAQLPEAGFGTFDGLLRLRVLELAADVEPSVVQVDPKGRLIVFTADNVVITTRLLEEMFPPVDSILDAGSAYQVELPVKPVLANLQRLSSVAEADRPLVVSVDGDRLTMSMNSQNTGAGDETLHLDVPAPVPVVFAVNLGYFREALTASGAATVTFGWTSPLMPLFFTTSDPLPVTCVVMPVAMPT